MCWVVPVELPRLGAPEVELGVAFDGESQAAVDLDSSGAHVSTGLSSEQLGHGGQGPGVAAGVTGPGGLMHEDTAAVDGGNAVGQVVGDRLERPDRLVELVAYLGAVSYTHLPLPTSDLV